jgi:hypothetical protein
MKTIYLTSLLQKAFNGKIMFHGGQFYIETSNPDYIGDGEYYNTDRGWIKTTPLDCVLDALARRRIYMSFINEELRQHIEDVMTAYIDENRDECTSLALRIDRDEIVGVEPFKRTI